MQEMFLNSFDGILALLEQLKFIDYFVLSLSFLLLIFSKKIILFFYHRDADNKKINNRVHVLRALNLFIIVSFGYFHLYLQETEQGIGLKIISVFVVMYLGYLFTHIFGYMARQRFGKIKEIEGRSRSVESYNSRLLSLLSSVFVFIIVLLSIIQILGFEGLLEAGGVIGFVGVFMALTHSSWAPDIFSGLIILNSNLIEEGDVIELTEDQYCLGLVFKTKMFHTEILNLVNNHRVMINNSKLRGQVIQNLSKFASAKGLRERLQFKIGYDHSANQVRSMFAEAFETAKIENALNVEAQHELEIGIHETGDHAIEWNFFYYTKDVKKIIAIRQNIREIIWDTAEKHGISLATPLTHDAGLTFYNKLQE